MFLSKIYFHCPHSPVSKRESFSVSFVVRLEKLMSLPRFQRSTVHVLSPLLTWRTTTFAGLVPLLLHELSYLLGIAVQPPLFPGGRKQKAKHSLFEVGTIVTSWLSTSSPALPSVSYLEKNGNCVPSYSNPLGIRCADAVVAIMSKSYLPRLAGAGQTPPRLAIRDLPCRTWKNGLALCNLPIASTANSP